MPSRLYLILSAHLSHVPRQQPGFQCLQPRLRRQADETQQHDHRQQSRRVEALRAVLHQCPEVDGRQEQLGGDHRIDAAHESHAQRREHERQRRRQHHPGHEPRASRAEGPSDRQQHRVDVACAGGHRHQDLEERHQEHERHAGLEKQAEPDDQERHHGHGRHRIDRVQHRIGHRRDLGIAADRKAQGQRHRDRQQKSDGECGERAQQRQRQHARDDVRGQPRQHRRRRREHDARNVPRGNFPQHQTDEQRQAGERERVDAADHWAPTLAVAAACGHGFSLARYPVGLSPTHGWRTAAFMLPPPGHAATGAAAAARRAGVRVRGRHR